MMSQVKSAVKKGINYVRPDVRNYMLDWPLDIGIETAVMNGVRGDYHEFGVFEGRSFIRSARNFTKQLRHEAADMKFWAYDSFEGLPETHDKYAPAHFVKGAYAAPEELFMKNVVKAGINKDKVNIVRGFYDQSLTKELAKEVFAERKIALTYIDCDIYESAVPVFEFITKGLQTGSVIVIDDWNRHHSHPCHGIQRAYYDWLDKYPYLKLNQIAIGKRIAFVVYSS